MEIHDTNKESIRDGNYGNPLLIQYKLYKWGARDGEYLDTPPFSGYNFLNKG